MTASETPLYMPNVLAVDRADAPPAMSHAEKARYRRAAFHARRLWPDAVGELVSRELGVVEEFGWALGAQGFGKKLLDAVEAAQRAQEESLARPSGAA